MSNLDIAWHSGHLRVHGVDITNRQSLAWQAVSLSTFSWERLLQCEVTCQARYNISTVTEYIDRLEQSSGPFPLRLAVRCLGRWVCGWFACWKCAVFFSTTIPLSVWSFIIWPVTSANQKLNVLFLKVSSTVSLECLLEWMRHLASTQAVTVIRQLGSPWGHFQSKECKIIGSFQWLKNVFSCYKAMNHHIMAG